VTPRGRDHAESRYCTLCGRKGTRGFVYLGGGGNVCKAQRACDRRRASFLRPLLRKRRREAA